MIKYNIKILVIILSFTSCKKQEVINTHQLIFDYSLESYGDYKNEKRQENKWYSEDSVSLFTLYENKTTNHFLYIVQNRNKDTIFKFFDSTSFDLKVRDFFKIKNDYFITLWDPSLKSYIGNLSIPNGKNSIYEGLFTYDSLNIYHIDSISFQLSRIEKPSITNIASAFKKTYKLKEDFKIIKSDSKIRLVKDSLNNKVFYESDTGLEIKKVNQEYTLIPYFFNKSKIEINQNNFLLVEDTFLTNNTLIGEVKYYYLFDDKFNNKGYSKIDLIFYNQNEKHIIKTSLDSLFDNEVYIIKSIDTNSSLSIEPFQCVNKQYFIYIHQENMEYWEGGFPNIFSLDTINWKIKRVLPFYKNKERNYTSLEKLDEVEILSTYYKSNLNTILRDFEIIEAGNEYRLKQNM